jgi:heterodisulfide reductase subunit C
MHTINLTIISMIAQVLFAVVFGVFAYFISKKVGLISKTIKLGRDIDLSDNPSQRWKNLIFIAFGQKKMFDKPGVAILHLAVYVGFILINAELIEIFVDGLFGTHRFLHGFLGGFYMFMINFFEVLALLVVLACVAFLVRRNIMKVSRFQPDRHMEMRNWPSLDANIILFVEIALMTAFFSMNAADAILQTRGEGHYAHALTGPFVISQSLIPLFEGFSTGTLVFIERFGWWFHIVGIFSFALYMTYSKHLHIVLAFPNTYFASLKPIGQMSNMPTVTTEVKIMLGLEQAPTEAAEVGRFGAKDVQDLTWKNLMDAYSCTECGRCTQQCPANQTGKLLSPRKIMMDTRDRLEDIQKGMAVSGAAFKDEKTLLGDYISDEEILACTSCNACVEACPIMINPLDIILQLRRYRVMEESQAPASWNGMFQNMETSMAPWKFSPDQRFDWAKE